MVLDIILKTITISIKKSVYKKLMELKRPNESLSRLIERLIEHLEKNPSSDFEVNKDFTDEFLREFF